MAEAPVTWHVDALSRKVDEMLDRVQAGRPTGPALLSSDLGVAATRQREIEAAVRWLWEAIERAEAPGAARARCGEMVIAGRRYWLTLEGEALAGDVTDTSTM